MGQERESWHLDKRVPLALILTLIGYGLGGIWYIGRMEARFDQRLAVLEQQFKEQRERDERQDRQNSEAMGLIRQQLNEISNKLDRVVYARLAQPQQ